MKSQKHRTIQEIAREIQTCWTNVYYAAEPYLRAMHELREITDFHGVDDAEGILLRFLGNAKNWRGDDAKRLKAELRGILQEKKR